MHPESEHGLRVQLATALRERDEARERARVAEAAWAKAKFRALPEYAQDTMDAVLARADVAESQIDVSEKRRDAAESALAAANARADAAVAEIVNEQRRFGEMQREAWKLEEALAAARRETTEALERAALEVKAAFEDGGVWDGLQDRIRTGKWTATAPDWSVQAGDQCSRIGCGKKVVATCLPHQFKGCTEHMREHDARCAYAEKALAAPGDGEEGKS